MPSIRRKRPAVINAGNAGDNPIVNAVPGNKIKVVNYVVVAAGAVTMIWRSGTNPISGPMPLAVNGGLVVPAGDEFAHFLETNVNEALNLNLGAAVVVGGHLTYVLEPF